MSLLRISSAKWFLILGQDIISAMLGFEELCTYKLKKSNASIIPNRVNSDVIENICQQRTMHNGANANPTYLDFLHYFPIEWTNS
jgi:hypothetical protein